MKCSWMSLVVLAVACSGDDPYSDNANAWDPAPLLDEKTAVGCPASANDRSLVLVVDDPVAEARLVIELEREVVVGQALEVTEEVGPEAIAHVDLGPGWANPCEDGPPPSGPLGDSYVGLGGYVTVDLRPDIGDFATLRGTASFDGLEFDGPDVDDAFLIEEIDIDQLVVDAQ